ncbi:hypothetical protein PAXRUDRAFT_823900 [Paxillus rubicundulus Ve08.2h10]|uniref:Uncharacterized protein n=1 Tax=Paxillus rubicundulus Ve08.2h10 TaxID=930991 RepID=A0A0D0E8D1_9AGAM|nr:hypothetical protein PAXRUDRAFT_823900 [Paxillus rubicundulus Ve08.2h10]
MNAEALPQALSIIWLRHTTAFCVNTVVDEGFSPFESHSIPPASPQIICKYHPVAAPTCTPFVITVCGIVVTKKNLKAR